MTPDETKTLTKELADQLDRDLSHIPFWTYDSALQIAGVVLSSGSPVYNFIAALEAEAAALAANQCEGPMVGDEHGHFRCGKLLEARLSDDGVTPAPPELALVEAVKVRGGDRVSYPMVYFDAALTSSDPYDDRPGPWYDMKKVAEIEKEFGVTFPRKKV